MFSYRLRVREGRGNNSSEQQRGGSIESFPLPFTATEAGTVTAVDRRRGWRQRRRFLAGARGVGVGVVFVRVVAADRGAARRRRGAAAGSAAVRAVAGAGLGEVAVVGRPADRSIGLPEFFAGHAAFGVKRVPDFGREGAA